ncbi:Benzene 1,2-dioxygenase subunit alpha [Gemmata obscuriglobus]|uniref:(2Fe-2S)-binding protein n=1 Tax=Gemmata obscuriglobus TaxID=114 RepID=A0A2Z3H6C9_9BACT|nr:SRPBCC family protein [Gemmata obscuriglobus]AWM36520.1 (2Fe-2S)-binding protein [Gemmata obscuriglobus]QEG30854.1 Benzene 1,2-dioxygenase subunit alpha [Gemmata obscuriglobus]VTS10186.1 choline monooxygenase : Rieske (2Fe-2S) domain protein OS=Roseiflexus castenholzii (strain DSM 13941 / HLO8) GN=Rcas_3791 PE=4 SV=1: Rieske: Ring_hydroxyl_A [Gemmata obscuriglobus UQM 2246]
MPNGTLQDLLTAFDPERPLERAGTIPNTWYTAPEIYALERDAVFARTWQMVGRADQVANPGQYLTADIAGEPVLVVRNESGDLKAFFNVCRHRAARLCTDECGTVTKLRCRYHGWTYDLSGALRGVPEFDGVQDFRREDNGLPPVAVAVWGPFVWVHLTPPREPVDAYLGPLVSWAAGAALGDLKWHARRSYDLRCNWKVYVDNYLDGGYHVNTVHPALAGTLDYTNYRTTCDGNAVLQSSPTKPAEGDAGQTRTGDAAYWWLYPNFMLNAYAGVMDTNLVLPLGPDRCRVVFDFYFADSLDHDFRRKSVEVAEQVQQEDIGVCEEVQRNLHSRSFSTGRFSVKRENGGHHFHAKLGRVLRGFAG